MPYRDPEKFRTYFRTWSRGNVKHRFQVLARLDRLAMERAMRALERARERFRDARRRVRVARQRIRRRPKQYAEALRRREHPKMRVLSMTPEAIKQRDYRRRTKGNAA